jgi:hypothetical protein
MSTWWQIWNGPATWSPSARLKWIGWYYGAGRELFHFGNDYGHRVVDQNGKPFDADPNWWESNEYKHWALFARDFYAPALSPAANWTFFGWIWARASELGPLGANQPVVVKDASGKHVSLSSGTPVSGLGADGGACFPCEGTAAGAIFRWAQIKQDGEASLLRELRTRGLR